MDVLINAAMDEQKVAVLDGQAKVATMRAISDTPPERLAEAFASPGLLKDILNLFGHDFPPIYEGQLPPHGILGAKGSVAKRPLNAFMAFRTYYLKLFPDAQQKNASGFLTQLWGGDPHRNKWALVAKVYSFLRDQLGKETVNLSAYLGVACPLMHIIEPAKYIRTFGWRTTRDEQGHTTFHQNATSLSENLAKLKTSEHPTTEIDLLAGVLSAGYFENCAQALMMRMWACQNGIMTTGSATTGDAVSDAQPLYEPVPTTPEKVSFINAVHDNRNLAARDLFGPDYDADLFQNRFVHSWEVQNLTGFQNVQISLADPPMESNALYNFNQPIESLPQVPEFDVYDSINTGIIDISSAWSVDKYLYLKQGHQGEQQYRKSQSNVTAKYYSGI
uniref:Mating type protein 1-1-1 n=1 Tax=Fusarium anguioides TaxID=183586 RepID=A0A386H8F6_9HYPO|nr:mating type protein 1-1-1 [Fusarium anguioides]